MCLRPDSRRIALGSSDTTVRVWDVETGEHVHVLEGHPSDDRAAVACP